MMRDRPFIPASDKPRPYSEILAERAALDPRRRKLEEIAEFEGAAADAADPAERKRLQCEAEAMRCDLHETSTTRR